jgi:hypothetical protein
MHRYITLRILKVTLDPEFNKIITTNNGAIPFIHSSPKDSNYKSLVVGKWVVIKTKGNELMSIENITSSKPKQTFLGMILGHVVNPFVMQVSNVLYYSGLKEMSKKLLSAIS